MGGFGAVNLPSAASSTTMRCTPQLSPTSSLTAPELVVRVTALVTFPDAAASSLVAGLVAGARVDLTTSSAIVFVNDFKTAVAAALSGITAADVVVNSITKGSIIVDHTISTTSISAAALEASVSSMTLSVN